MKSFFFFFLLLIACETLEERSADFLFEGSLEDLPSQEIKELSFQAMGTLWRVLYWTPRKSFKEDSFRLSLIQNVSDYDERFSTWSSESELGRKNLLGYKGKICPSPGFLKALKTAQNLYQLTHGVFDVSLGTGDLDRLQWDSHRRCFSFLSGAPKSLDFNGFIKGVAVASLAQFLVNAGVNAFYVNAGNGNLAYRVPEEAREAFLMGENLFPKGREKVYFLSQSNSVQSHTGKDIQHIEDPKKMRHFKEKSQVYCVGRLEERDKWENLGALSDAFSTALTIKSSLNLPENCFQAEF